MEASHSGSYNINDKITGVGSLNIFKSTIMAVSEHRQSTQMSGAQDFYNRINEISTATGAGGTALGYFRFGTTPGIAIGTASAVVTYGLKAIKPKDIKFNIYYQMKRTP